MPNCSVAERAELPADFAHEMRLVACDIFSLGEDYRLNGNDPNDSAGYRFLVPQNPSDLSSNNPDYHLLNVRSGEVNMVVYALDMDARRGIGPDGRVDDHRTKEMGTGMLNAMIEYRKERRLNSIRRMSVLIVAGNAPMELITGDPDGEPQDGWVERDGLLVPEDGLWTPEEEKKASWVPQDKKVAYVTCAAGGWFNGELVAPQINQRFTADGKHILDRSIREVMQESLGNPDLDVKVIHLFENEKDRKNNDNGVSLAFDAIVSDNVDAKARDELAAAMNDGVGETIQDQLFEQFGLGPKATGYTSVRQGGKPKLGQAWRAKGAKAA
jgi:hypothetical protein